MPRTTTEPKRPVNISVTEKTIAQLDQNLAKLTQILLSKGADPERVRKELSRSSFIRQLIELAANAYGFEIVKNAVLLAFDIDGSQTELDLKP